MTNLQRRLLAHKRKKTRMLTIKRIINIVCKVSLVIIMVPALVYYPTGLRNSLSFFTHQTKSPFFKFRQQAAAFQSFSFMGTNEKARLDIYGDSEILLPEEGMVALQYYAVVTDNGRTITDPWVYWSLEEAPAGIAINSQTGSVSA